MRLLWLLLIYLWLYCMYIHCSILMNLHLFMIIMKIIYCISLHLPVLCLIYHYQLWWSILFCIICCNYSFLCYSYTKLFSLCGLKGIWRVTILGTVTIGCLVFLHIYFWSLTSSLDFLLNSNPSLISTCFFFPIVYGNPLDAPLLLSKTCWVKVWNKEPQSVWTNLKNYFLNFWKITMGTTYISFFNFLNTFLYFQSCN